MKINHLQIISIILFAAIALSFKEDEKAFSATIVEKMASFNRKFPHEEVYVHLDKNVYKAGDDIWFKAYVICLSKNGNTSLSKGLTAKLYNPTGGLILQDKFLIENNTTEGDFILPDNLADGVYTFVAYSSWMENESPAKVFKKFIEIRKTSNSVKLSVSLSDSLYKPAQKVTVSAHLSLPDGIAIVNNKLKYLIIHDNKTIEKGDVTTGADGNAKFSFMAPDENTHSPIYITLKTKYESQDNKWNILMPPVPDKVILEFFPEGGNIISGVQSYVAFKATDSLFNPVNVEGIILDPEGETIGHFKSFADGRGIFSILCNNEKKLKAQITKPEGIKCLYDLPQPISHGLSLSVVKNDPDTLFLKIALPQNDPEEKVTIAIQVNGNVNCVGSTKIKGANLVKIPKGELDRGVAEIVLFDSQNILSAKRLVYIEKKDNYKVTLTTEKDVFHTREKVNLTIKLPHQRISAGNFSLSVSKNESHPGEMINSGIASEVLINSAFAEKISGHSINASSYYPDFLVLTAGQSLFDWSKINSAAEPAYHSKDVLSGVVYDQQHKPLTNAKVNVLNATTFQLYRAVSDSDGWFEIPLSDFSFDKTDYSISATASNGDKNTNVVLQNRFSNIVDNLALNDPGFLNPLNGRISKNSIFNQELIGRENTNSANSKLPEKKDQYNPSKTLFEIISEIKPYQIINNKIIFPGGLISYGLDGAKFVLDGVLLSSDDASYLKSIPVSDIERVRVLMGPSETSRYTAFAANGIIEITTKRGGKHYNETKKDDLLRVNNYRVSRSFDSVIAQSKNKDQRTTLYWNPQITFNESGEANLSFSTSDVTGKFEVIIEGIIENNVPVSGKLSFVVK